MGHFAPAFVGKTQNFEVALSGGCVTHLGAVGDKDIHSVRPVENVQVAIFRGERDGGGVDFAGVFDGVLKTIFVSLHCCPVSSLTVPGALMFMQIS